MNTLASTTATALTLDPRVEDTPGLYAFPVFDLGYAYFYFYLPLTGGS